ncbi:hydrogenase maturation protein [Streptomyces sp. NPDC020681]|uniref:hydrogenase maturation protein n=1 Tax=Streptomyces sp. NPDC020681 TaxID=3365083 RepID=UPI00379822A5
MRILLISSAFNSLTQRFHTVLRDRGHTVCVQLALGDDAIREGVDRTDPHLILAPMLTTTVPEDIWSTRTVLIIHPGPLGDRGPSSLDWALHERARDWGVTVLQAGREMDAGDIWASVPFHVPPGISKSDLYRGEVADAAVEAGLLAVDRFAAGNWRPVPLDSGAGYVRGRLRPYHAQEYRRIDWKTDSTAAVLRKLRAADSRPGVLEELYGTEYYLHGGHPEDELHDTVPGRFIATRDGAICRATSDGAVWIAELRRRRTKGSTPAWKLPAADVLSSHLAQVPEVPVDPGDAAGRATYSQIRYRESGPVGLLSFSFPGGAMSTDQCRRLLTAYRTACTRPTSVLVLGPERDIFSNGIHLGMIEAAADPAAESWANINAMNDLVEAILTTTDRHIVAALSGNAAAGGLMMALAADEVWCREGAVLNPHYRTMGLYGSEYWTYTLPRRVGAEMAERLTTEALPVSAAAARSMGLIDVLVPGSPGEYRAWVTRAAANLATSPMLATRLDQKKARREQDERTKPLAAYRAAELDEMNRNFRGGPTEPYPSLRRAFVHKTRPPQTPARLILTCPHSYESDRAGTVALSSV